MKQRLILSFFLVLGLASSGLGLEVARAQDEYSAEVPLRRHRFDTTGARNYWSPDRMRQARASIPSVSEMPSVQSILPNATNFDTQRVVSQAPVAQRRAAVLARTTEIGSEYTTFPLSTSGKLFTRDAIGQLFVCSATVVSSSNLSVVWTAGHCLHEGNGGDWVQSAVFVPAYKDGVAPFGEWPVIDAYVPVGWTDYDQQWQYDMAAAVVAPNSSGYPIANVVGGRGISWNEDQDQFFDAYGYPAAPPFSGERMFICDSSVSYLADFLAPPPIGITCDMSQGASGGGWIIHDEFLNSHTSFGAPEVLPGVLFGPYFNEVTGELFEAASAVDVPGVSPAPTTPINATQTRFDPNDTRSALDIKETRMDIAAGVVAVTVRMHNTWSSRLLAKPSNNVYVDFDPQGDRQPDYYAWIYRDEVGRLVSSVERYTSGVSQTVSSADVRRIDGRTVEVSFALPVLGELGDSLGWYASTKFRNRAQCPRACWDFAPNRGVYRLNLN